MAGFKIIVLLLLYIVAPFAHSQPLTHAQTKAHYSAIKTEMTNRFESVIQTKRFREDHWIDKDEHGMKTYVVHDCGFTQGINFATEEPSKIVTNAYTKLFETAKSRLQSILIGVQLSLK